MNLFQRLFAKFHRQEPEDFYEEEKWDEEEDLQQINYDNKELRMDYVKNCLEKMADATRSNADPPKLLSSNSLMNLRVANTSVVRMAAWKDVACSLFRSAISRQHVRK